MCNFDMTPINRLDLNLLRVFDLLMQERSVTKAAALLHLSQSTVSHSLSRLRQTLDDPLFILTGREMTPTQKALTLAGPTRQALLLIDQGLRQSDSFNPEQSERAFKIAVSGSIEQDIIPKLVNQLHRASPELGLEVFELSSSDYEKELEKGELDLVVGFAGNQHLSDKLLKQNWFSTSLVCLATESFKTQEPGLITSQELVSKPHIYTSSWGHSQSIVDKYLDTKGLIRSVGVRVPTFTSVPALLNSERYLVVLPKTVALHFVGYNPLKILELKDGHLELTYEIASHPITASDPAVIWLKQLMEAMV